MGRPRIPRSVVWPGLMAVARGVTLEQAAISAGVSVNTLRRRAAEEAVVVVRQRQQRPDALTLDERVEIAVGIGGGQSDEVIAGRLGRHRSTVWREISLNGGRAAYRAFGAHERADQQARRVRRRWFDERGWLWDEVCRLIIEQRWSPKAIARRLRRDHPDDPQWWVSHESLSSCLCKWSGSWWSEVGVDAVGVDEGELFEGLFPVRRDLSFDEASGRLALVGG